MFSSLGLTSGRRTFPDVALLLTRVWFGLAMAFAHGLAKMMNLAGFVASVERRGIPLPNVSAPVAALSEFVGGLLLAVGLFTRPACAALFATMFVAGFVVHASDPFPKKELAIAYLVVAVAIALSGPGRYSVDAWWSRKRR